MRFVYKVAVMNYVLLFLVFELVYSQENYKNDECKLNGVPVLLSKKEFKKAYGLPLAYCKQGGKFTKTDSISPKKRSNWIKYSKYYYETFEFICFKKYSLIHFVYFFNTNNVFQCSDLILNKDSRLSDLLKLFSKQDLLLNYGVNALSFYGNPDFYHNNIEFINHISIECCDIGLVQFIFYKDKLYSAYISPRYIKRKF